jgi:hypothetical protein
MTSFFTRPSLDSARRAWGLRVLRIGGVIQGCFAAFWLARGGLAIGGLVGTALAAALLAVALAVLVYGLIATAGLTPRPRGTEGTRIERGVTVASIIQLAASFAAPLMVTTLGHPDLVVPSIAVTIGPLLLYLDYRLSIPRYRFAGWALILAPIVCALLVSGPALSAVVGLVAGTLLLSTAILGFRQLTANAALHIARMQRRVDTTIGRPTPGAGHMITSTKESL